MRAYVFCETVNQRFVKEIEMKKLAFLSVGVVLGISVMLVMAATYATVLPGTIHHAYPVYKDSDTITIKPGYGECNGHYWDIMSDTDHDMTSLASGADFHYIYVDGNNSNFPDPNIFDTTTEPAWSDSKLGWYNGNHRCIGVVWSPVSSSTISQFTCNSDQKYSVSTGQPLDNGNPDDTYQTLEATAYIPVNAIEFRVYAFNTDYVGTAPHFYVVLFVTTYENPNSQIIGRGYYVAEIAGWLELERNSSRDLKWYGNDNDDNSFDVHIQGYQIER